MAEGAIAQDLIIRLTADISQLQATLRQAQKELDGVGKGMAGGASNISLNIRKQFSQIEQFAKLTGDSTKGVGEKMNLVSNGLKTLVQNGKGATDGAKNLATQLALLKKEALGGNDGLKSMATNLLSRVVPGFSQANAAVKQLKIAFPQLASMAGTAAVAVTALAAGYKYVIAPGVQFNSMLEQQSVAFTAMFRNADRAQSMLSDLKKLSLSTPIGLSEGAASAKQLIAYGFNQNEIIDNLKMMKTVSSAVNVSLGDLAYVYGTLRAQGRAYTRDLMQFAMRGIPIYEYLSKTMGVTVTDLKKMTEEGKVGFAEVEAAMKAMTGEGGKFNGMLEASMRTTQGLQTQISNTWQMFTGDAAKGTSVVFKDILKDVLSLVRTFQALGPTVNAIFSVISFALGNGLKGIIDYIQFFANINRLLQNIVLSLGDALKWTGKWLADLIGLDRIIAMATKGLADAKKWLYDTIPVLKTIENSAKNIASAIKSWWDRDTKKAFSVDVTAVIDKNGQEAYDSLYKSLQGLSTLNYAVSSGNYALAVSFLNAQTALKELGYTTEDMATVMAKMYNFSEDGLKKFLSAVKAAKGQTEGFYKYFTRLANKPLSFYGFGDYSNYEDFYKMGSEIGKDVVRGYANEFTKLNKTWETLFMDPAIIEEKSKEWKETTMEYLQDVVDEMSQQGHFMAEGSGGLAFLRELQAYIDRLRDSLGSGAGKGAKGSTFLDDFLQQYLEFRAEWATSESGFNEALVSALNSKLDPLNYTTGIMGDLSMLDRQLALIDQKYDKIAANMSQEEWNVAGQAVQQMREMEKVAARLNNELEQIQGNLEINMDPTKTIDLLKKQYDIEVEISKLKTLTDKERLDNIKKQIELEQKIVDIALQGDQEAYKRANNQMIVQGQQSGDYQQVAGGIAGNAIAGTDIGKLIGGADPITMLIASFVEMMMSIENVSKVLNFFGTIMDGIKSMIEGPTNEALKNVVLLLAKVGEAVGAILVPFIEVFGDLLDLVAAPLVLVAEILKRFFVALKPLIKIILYLNYPLAWIGRLFGQLADALGSFLKTEEDRQKDLENLYDKELATLQNLYEVGALSGAEYEARLAELKARYAKDTPTEADPYLVQIFTEIFGALDAMGLALDELFKALTPLIDAVVAIMVPFLKPLIDLLLRMLGGFFKDIASIVTAISNLITSLLNGDWSKAGEYLAKAFKAVAGFFINPLLRIFNWISQLIASVGNWFVIGSDPFTAFTVPELAVGSGNIPSNMLSMLHQGEAVVPKTFMDAIRSGELALTGAGAGGGTIIVNVYNEGSVIAERDLNRSIYDGITTLKKKGYV